MGLIMPVWSFQVYYCQYLSNAQLLRICGWRWELWFLPTQFTNVADSLANKWRHWIHLKLWYHRLKGRRQRHISWGRPQAGSFGCQGVQLTHGDEIHDDVIKWKHFPRNWPFVRGIHRSPVNSLHKGQWRGALMFSLICVWINDWVNNREAGDLRRYRAHYDVIVMYCVKMTPHHNWVTQRLRLWCPPSTIMF